MRIGAITVSILLLIFYVFKGTTLAVAGGTITFPQTHRFSASGGMADDRFGRFVAVTENTVAVGSHHDDDRGENSGSVYVFDRNQGGPNAWRQIAKLTANDGEAGDEFGVSVAISGNTIVVGALRDDDGAENSGSAYVFERNEGWGQCLGTGG